MKIHAVIAALQAVNIADVGGYISFLPPKYSSLIVMGLTGVQAIVGWYAHYVHPVTGEKIDLAA